MTRHEIKHEDKVLVFGNDDFCGEYLQIWQRPADPKGRSMQDKFGPDPDEMLVNEDKHTGFNHDKMIELIAEHGFELPELEEEATPNLEVLYGVDYGITL